MDSGFRFFNSWMTPLYYNPYNNLNSEPRNNLSLLFSSRCPEPREATCKLQISRVRQLSLLGRLLDRICELIFFLQSQWLDRKKINLCFFQDCVDYSCQRRSYGGCKRNHLYGSCGPYLWFIPGSFASYLWFLTHKKTFIYDSIIYILYYKPLTI